MMGWTVFPAAAASGCLLTWALLPVSRMRPRWAAVMFAISLGLGAGVALQSVLYFLLLLAGAADLIVAADAVVLSAAVAVFHLMRDREPRDPEPLEIRTFRRNWILALVLAIAASAIVVRLADEAKARPHGEWDAWAIWNLRAKFLAGPGDTWKFAVSPLLTRRHPDYPLLTSGFIASVWRASGQTSDAIPRITAFLFLAAVLALLPSSIALMRGATSGLLAGCVLTVSGSFVQQVVWQYADVPLSFYYLGAVALAIIGCSMESRPALALAGAFASFAAWTKNEGFPFFCCVALYFLLTAGYSRFRWLIAGALPVILVTAFFKLFLAPAADPLLKQSLGVVLNKLVDPSRYGQILRAVAGQAAAMGNGLTHPLVLLAIIAPTLGFSLTGGRARSLLFGCATLITLLSVYAFVYVVTPFDLAWHLGTSLSRLAAQVWPMFLFLFFLALNPVEDFCRR